MTQNRRLSQKNSVILYQLVMGDRSDSTGGIVQSSKRSASAAAVPLCKTQDCLAFNKKLGNGYCKDCCLERNVPFKSSKKKTVEKIDDTATPAATTTFEPAEFSIILNPSVSTACTLPQPSVAIGDGQRFHAIGTKVLICAETNCAIATVVSIHIAKTPQIAERLKDYFKYIVQDANNGVKSMVGSICANTYIDVTDWPAWPAGAHPRGTLVHGQIGLAAWLINSSIMSLINCLLLHLQTDVPFLLLVHLQSSNRTSSTRCTT
jgi:hypothetical protein